MVDEVSLDTAWASLTDDPNAVLIDVRTTAEWAEIGIPDLSSINKKPRLVQWVQYPDGLPNPDFVAQATEGITPEQPLFLLCRSGARSAGAAHALVEAGYTNSVNVVAGFEGNITSSGGRAGGWKDSLPWSKQTN